jgi:hypothetical protein
MTHEISPQLETLLNLAATIRRDHEVARARSQDMSRDIGYPKDLHGYVQQVKGLVGDWDSRESAQTYYPVVKEAMVALLSRAVARFPAQLDVKEANQLVVELLTPADGATPAALEEAGFAALEIWRFWAELLKAQDLLALRLLAIKYNVQ